jgi:hypothetical protein
MIGTQAVGKSPAPLVIPQSTGTVTLRNIGHVTVWIGDSEGIAPFAGIELAVGDECTVAGDVALFLARLPYDAHVQVGSSTIDAPPPYTAISYHQSDTAR